MIGGDGYCGWPSALALATIGHEVTIVDNLIRRRWDRELGISTLTPIRTLDERLAAWHCRGGAPIEFVDCDVTDYPALRETFARLRPEAIVHFAQQRSAPFSMIDRDRAAETLVNNTLGNLNVLWAMHEVAPDAHLVKLGTMGEYGTPNIQIEEGFITIEHKGRSDTLPFPKQPNSFYHLTKVSDSDQIFFACKAWKLRATDLNQGVVYGLETDETPAEPGEFRVFNQFTEIFSVLELGERVQRVGATMGYDVTLEHVPNPRTEREAHYYSTVNEHLLGLGLSPHLLDDAVVGSLIAAASANRARIDPAQIAATVRWAGPAPAPAGAPGL